MTRFAGFLAVSLLLVGCSGTSRGDAGNTATGGTFGGTDGTPGNGQPTDLSGAWCGLQVQSPAACVGDEALYMEVEQEGTTLSGVFCEAYEKECYPLTGTLDGSSLSFEYHFSGETVTGTFETGDASLQGSLFSTKCGCEIPTELFRVE